MDCPEGSGHLTRPPPPPPPPPVIVAGDCGRCVVVEVAGGGAFDLAGAEAGTAGGQQGGQDGAADDTGQVSRAGGADSRAAVSWSRAASRAVVKLARSGLVPGWVSMAVTMAMRSSW